LCHVSIVGQDEKSFRLGVEAADIKKARKFWRQKIEDGVARIGIGTRGNKAGRLVKDQVKRAFAANELAADFDMVLGGWLSAEVGANPAIDRNPALGDQLVAMPPRADAGGREETIEAHAKS